VFNDTSPTAVVNTAVQSVRNTEELRAIGSGRNRRKIATDDNRHATAPTALRPASKKPLTCCSKLVT
jgi:hypothetical protein